MFVQGVCSSAYYKIIVPIRNMMQLKIINI